MSHGRRTSHAPNCLLCDLPSHKQQREEPLCLWALERQAGGIEPGELATRRPAAAMKDAFTDPVFAVLAILVVAFCALALSLEIYWLLEEVTR